MLIFTRGVNEVERALPLVGEQVAAGPGVQEESEINYSSYLHDKKGGVGLDSGRVKAFVSCLLRNVTLPEMAGVSWLPFSVVGA